MISENISFHSNNISCKTASWGIGGKFNSNENNGRNDLFMFFENVIYLPKHHIL